MQEEIQKFLNIKEELTTRFKNWCKDKTIPLEERWGLFIQSGLGEIDVTHYRPPGINWDKLTLYDDFYTDRYAKVLVSEMLYITSIRKKEFGLTETDEINFKEYFLERFIKGFINDW